ncbi:hypothetical protein M434DRAFT_29213 [Hypoxylon sp. CO27-5]|nr:hypothetical protein M434DRAFT_29213 [Hypoxylon sp. CO27-5]
MSLSPWQLCFHADLKCRVRHCNNKRIINNTTSSPYCRHHCCTVCLKLKTCFKRGHGHEGICHHHGCIYENCREPRSKKHPNSPYCANHACSVKDCNKPRDGPGVCCKKHTCQNRNCINCANGDSSHSSRSHSSGPHRYCHGHQVCEVEDCEQFVFLDASNRAARYCFRHYCAPSPGCGGQRVEGEGASGCRDHTCALYPSCTHPRADPIHGLFCEDHECADPGCRKQKYDSGGVITGLRSRTGIWCADHMCMAALTRREDCVNRRAGTATNPIYCADHELCEEAECNNFRAVRGRNRLQTRCEEHLLTKCAFPTCLLDAENGAASCRYHTCRASGCLATLPSLSAVSTSLFCDAHRCSEPGCANPRSTTTTTPTSTPLGGGDAAGAYCVEHGYINRLGLGSGRCRYHHRGHRHGFGGGGGGGGFCGWHGGCGCGCGGGGGGDDDDDDDSDDEDSDHDDGCGGDDGSGGNSSSIGVGVDMKACFHCGGIGDCGSRSKKKHCHK